MNWGYVEPEGLFRLHKPAKAHKCYKGIWKPWCEWRQWRTSSTSSKPCFFCISYLLVKRRKSNANLAAQQAREQHRRSGMAGSCTYLALYWLCPHWSSSQRHTFLVQRHLQPCVNNDRVSVGRIFLYCFILPPVFCVCISDRAESKASWTSLQCLLDKDAANYLSPGQHPSLDCHTYILVEDLFPNWKYSVNWSACSIYGKLILHQSWKSTSLTSQASDVFQTGDEFFGLQHFIIPAYFVKTRRHSPASWKFCVPKCPSKKAWGWCLRAKSYVGSIFQTLSFQAVSFY